MASTDLPRIAELRGADAQACVALSAEAGWNQVEADWRFMLVAGTGFAARDAKGAPVGSALILSLGPSLAWISMVLVTVTHRRLGLGTALLARCLEACEQTGVLGALDATELGEPVYRPLGFRDVFALRRWRLGRAITAESGDVSVGISRVTAADLAAIAAFDRLASGLERAQLLAHLATRGAACVARDAQGRVLGAAFSRDGRVATQLGPIVAADAGVARSLLVALTRELAPPFILDVPQAQTAFSAVLAAHGAETPRGFMRMTRGEPGALAQAGSLFAIAGPELG